MLRSWYGHKKRTLVICWYKHNVFIRKRRQFFPRQSSIIIQQQVKALESSWNNLESRFTSPELCVWNADPLLYDFVDIVSFTHHVMWLWFYCGWDSWSVIGDNINVFVARCSLDFITVAVLVTWRPLQHRTVYKMYVTKGWGQNFNT